jgi:hypothetical protein
MFFEATVVIKSLYGLKVKADPKREKKLKTAIDYLGNKYCLSKQVERKDAK